MSRPPIREYVLVNTGSDDGEACVIVTKQDYDMHQNFACALNTSETWGEFWEACTDYTRSYVVPFCSCDEVEPKSSDLLSDLYGYVWILDDAEFPMPQMSDTGEYGNGLGSEFLKSFVFEVLRTEGGGKVCLYDPSRASEIVIAARKEGVLLYRGESEVGCVGHHAF